MSHYYMRMQSGYRPEITRTAHRNSGGRATLKSWQYSVDTSVHQMQDDATDKWSIDINALRTYYGSYENRPSYHLEFRHNPNNGKSELILPDGSLWIPRQYPENF